QTSPLPCWTHYDPSTKYEQAMPPCQEAREAERLPSFRGGEIMRGVFFARFVRKSLTERQNSMVRTARWLVCIVCLWMLATSCWAKSKSLRIYSIDVEGGQATLIVSPLGESLLVDTGWPGFDGRDAQRIADAVKAAGLNQIDDVLITH